MWILSTEYIPWSIAFITGCLKRIQLLDFMNRTWLWLEPPSKRAASNNWLSHRVNTQLFLFIMGGSSWQVSAHIMRKDITQPLPRTAQGLPLYLPSAQHPEKQSHKLHCFPENKTESYLIFAPKDTYFFMCIAAWTQIKLTFFTNCN